MKSENSREKADFRTGNILSQEYFEEFVKCIDRTDCKKNQKTIE